MTARSSAALAKRGTSGRAVPPDVTPTAPAAVQPATAEASKTEAWPDLRAPELYLNRELTWLEFNRRVLHEAQDPRTPLLERVKFLAIVNSNLDEFFMKRIGGLKQQVGAGVKDLTVDGRTPSSRSTDRSRWCATSTATFTRPTSS